MRAEVLHSSLAAKLKNQVCEDGKQAGSGVVEVGTQVIDTLFEVGALIVFGRDTQLFGEAYKLKLVVFFVKSVLLGVKLLVMLSAAFMIRFLHGFPVIFCAATDMLK